MIACGGNQIANPPVRQSPAGASLSMNLAEKIEQLAAHMRRKPRDHGATRKMAALLKKRDGMFRFDALLKLYYPASMINIGVRSPLLDSLEPVRPLMQLRTLAKAKARL